MGSENPNPNPSGRFEMQDCKMLLNMKDSSCSHFNFFSSFLLFLSFSLFLFFSILSIELISFSSFFSVAYSIMSLSQKIRSFPSSFPTNSFPTFSSRSLHLHFQKRSLWNIRLQSQRLGIDRTSSNTYLNRKETDQINYNYILRRAFFLGRGDGRYDDSFDKTKYYPLSLSGNASSSSSFSSFRHHFRPLRESIETSGSNNDNNNNSNSSNNVSRRNGCEFKNSNQVKEAMEIMKEYTQKLYPIAKNIGLNNNAMKPNFNPSGILYSKFENGEENKKQSLKPSFYQDNRHGNERERKEGGNYNFNQGNKGGGNKGKINWGQLVSFAGLVTLLGKSKAAIAALKIFKMGPLVSMAISSFAYSLVFGPAYGVGMVFQIFLHECGHLFAMKYYKVPFSPMIFIPFMGASIAMEKYPRNAYEEAIIALGGPMLGTVGAMAFTTAGMMTGHQVLFALANWGYIVNLFNLLPIGTLDGGRVADSLSPYIGVAGIAGGGYLAYTGYITSPIFYLILASGTYSTGSRLLGYHHVPPHYYNLPRSKQTQIVTMYLGLVGILLGGMTFNDVFRKSPKQIQYEKQHGSSAERPWTVEEEYEYQNSFEKGQGQEGKLEDYFNTIDKYTNLDDEEDEW